LLMPDAGHVAQLEFPQRVAAALREFFASAWRPAIPPLDQGMTGTHGTVEGSAGAAFEVAPADRRPP
ncbi:MAG: hypothetical protein ACRDV3_02120, partial [Acidothermaceae bacterium]